MSENHKITIQKFPFSESQFMQRVKNDTTFTYTPEEELAMCRTILGSIDLPSTASVCVYPRFVALAKEKLQGTGVKVASVAGAFPAGQLPIELKVAEVEYAVAQGADEIDMVISRGSFLEGNYQEVFNEICAIRKACAGKTLKVILETASYKARRTFSVHRSWPFTPVPIF